MIRPGFNISEGCLNRRLNDGLSVMTGETFVDSCMKAKDYATEWNCIYSEPHLMGHAATGCMVSGWVSCATKFGRG